MGKNRREICDWLGDIHGEIVNFKNSNFCTTQQKAFRIHATDKSRRTLYNSKTHIHLKLNDGMASIAGK